MIYKHPWIQISKHEIEYNFKIKRSFKMTNNEKYSEDAFTFPEWLNVGFIKNVVKKKLRLLRHKFRAETLKRWNQKHDN